uniref:Ig-like domain-containing protein n=1 Tax=Gallus gallus TaxID=9031 RepID=A0A8V0ZXT0_CHICK
MVCRGRSSWGMSSCHGCAIPVSCCCPPPGVCAQLRLETSGGGVRAPGDSVHFSCQGSGFSFGSYAVLWYRQALGGRLEWLSFINSWSYTRYSPDVEGRATVSRDDSQSVSYLSLSALRPHDSAHYLCAVHTGTGNPAELQQKTSSWAQPQLQEPQGWQELEQLWAAPGQ